MRKTEIPDSEKAIRFRQHKGKALSKMPGKTPTHIIEGERVRGMASRIAPLNTSEADLRSSQISFGLNRFGGAGWWLIDMVISCGIQIQFYRP